MPEEEDITKLILGIRIETIQDFIRLFLQAGAIALTKATREAIEVNQYAINLAYSMAKELLPVGKDLEEEMKKLEERLAKNPNDIEAKTELTKLMLRHITRAFLIKNALIYFKLTKEDIMKVDNYLKKYLEPLPELEKETKDKEETEETLPDTEPIMG
jgi:tyrosyl-tRNA synthetase